MIKLDRKIRIKTREEIVDYLLKNDVVESKTLAKLLAERIFVNHYFLDKLEGKEVDAFVHSNGDAQINQSGFCLEKYEYEVVDKDWSDRDSLPTGDPIGDTDEPYSISKRQDNCIHSYKKVELFTSFFYECEKCKSRKEG